jgi:hypothetical protein
MRELVALTEAVTLTLTLVTSFICSNSQGGRSLLIRAGSSDEGVGYLVGLEGRGGGVDPEDLKIFIQTHSSDQHPPKTANQLYDPMHLHRNGWRTTVGTLFGSKYMIRMMLW